jgi:hypothetical protein
MVFCNGTSGLYCFNTLIYLTFYFLHNGTDSNAKFMVLLGVGRTWLAPLSPFFSCSKGSLYLCQKIKIYGTKVMFNFCFLFFYFSPENQHKRCTFGLFRYALTPRWIRAYFHVVPELETRSRKQKNISS